MTLKVINYLYSGDGIDFLTSDGSIIHKTFRELEYPYFYGIPDYSRRLSEEEYAHIIETKKMPLNILTPDGVITQNGYKIVVDEPRNIPMLTSKFKVVCEGNIPYIRRIAVDGIIEWDRTLGNYADIDIEEVKGELKLIGYRDSTDNEYIPLYDVKEFADIIEKRRITTVFAWNGKAYDFLKLQEATKSDYFMHILKLDAMEMYKIFMQKSYRTLNQAGIDTGAGEKVSFDKPFTSLTKEELERYNEQDVLLQKEIMDRTGIRSLIPVYSNYVMLNANEISAIRTVDNLMMHRFGDKALLLDRKTEIEKEKYQGGYVITPISGLYRNVASLDTNSLYPHVVMYEEYTGDGGYIFNLAKRFEREIYDLRVKYKKLYAETHEPVYNVEQQMYKILMNGSFYGVFGNVYYRYYDKNIAAFITAGARNVLKRLIDIAQSSGYKVIYGDTDSIFVEGLEQSKAQEFTEYVNRQIAPYEVKLEKFFTKMIIF